MAEDDSVSTAIRSCWMSAVERRRSLAREVMLLLFVGMDPLQLGPKSPPTRGVGSVRAYRGVDAMTSRALQNIPNVSQYCVLFPIIRTAPNSLSISRDARAKENPRNKTQGDSNRKLIHRGTVKQKNENTQPAHSGFKCPGCHETSHGGGWVSRFTTSLIYVSQHR